MYANKNNLRSLLTANVSTSATSISITAGEGILRDTDTVACLEHIENEVVTKREIIKITAKSTDTFTVTRGFATCIMNDSTKAQGNTKQSFSTGDYLSLYLSKELRESITTGISTNQTAITAVQGRISTVKNCIDGCCCNWIAKVQCLNNSHYCNGGFGDGSDGDLIVEGNEFLCADIVYNFKNLYICSGGCLRFEGQGVPQIKVYDHYVNDGVIDTRAGYVKTCSCTKKMIFGQTNTACNKACNTYICPGQGGAYGQGGTQCDMQNGCNAVSDTCGGAGGRGSRNRAEAGEEGFPADGCNGGAGGCGAGSCRCGYGAGGAGGGGGGGAGRFGNGGEGGWGGNGNVTSSGYDNSGGGGGNGGNSGLRGCGGNGGRGGYHGALGKGGNGGCGYIGGNGGCGGGGSLNCGYTGGNGGDGGCGIYKGGDGGYMGYGYCYGVQNGGNGGNAITNIYGFILNARCVSGAGCIRACGGFGGAGGSTQCTGSWKYRGHGGNGGNGANGGQVIYAYMHGEPEQICVNGGAGGKGGCGGINCKYKQISNGTDGCAGTDGWKVVYKVANL